ncbi:DoxX family protein [Micromonospora sp. CPCC 206061]|uniref:DoxX family protein n=1 Tax=Micromonospora sp. CPCC 206061 TaxID=3122410 RepID=UPI002FEFE8C9
MTVATTIISVLLAALLVLAAARKLSHRPSVVATYRRVGVPEERLNLLAVLLLAGAAGLVVGLWWAPAGVAAAAALVGYFGLAIGAHVRAHDVGNTPMPALYLALSAAALTSYLAD